MLTDLKAAWRSYRAQPMLMASVVATCGLFGGLAVALFSAFDALTLRPLPYEAAERLVHLHAPPEVFSNRSYAERQPLELLAASTPLFERRARVRTAEIFEAGSEALVDWSLRPALVTPEFFDLFGGPRLGRAFDSTDAAPKAGNRIILGHEVWRDRFNADPAIVNGTVAIPGTELGDPWIVVGVMPPGFSFPLDVNVWLPHDRRYWEVLEIPSHARLAAGVTLDQVRAALPGVVVTPLRDHVRPPGASSLGILVAAVLSLWLMAWVQVASLLLTRLTQRAGDLRVRVALGANHLQLYRPLVLEAGGLVLAASLTAFGVGRLLIPVIANMLPAEITMGHALTTDLRAFTFVLVTSLATAALLSSLLISSLTVSGRPLANGPAGLRSTGTPGSKAFLACQLALTVGLLYLSGLFWVSARNMSDAPLGFDPRALVAVRQPSEAIPRGMPDKWVDEELRRQQQRYVSTLEAVAAIPGVRTATTSNKWPLQPRSVETLRLFLNRSSEPVFGRLRYIGPEYAQTIGARLLAGRDVQSTDPPLTVALVNRSLAVELGGPSQALGQEVGGNPTSSYRVVGVVEDIAVIQAGESPVPEVFVFNPFGAVLLARLDDRYPRSDVLVGVRHALSEVWGDRAPREVVLLEMEVRRTTAEHRARQQLLAVVAVVALPLALLGLMGVFSTDSVTGTKEIAIRLAVGATASGIVVMILRRVMIISILGVVAGLAVGWGAGRMAAHVLFGIGPTDWSIMATSILAISLLLALASVSGVRRIRRVSLMSALKEPG